MSGTTATADGLAPDTTYAFSVFARRGSGGWVGPVSTTVTTPSGTPGRRVPRW
ncbi:hypothetical protein [Nocardioides sambongensis]|uniref:hypothetical protein n=1 Tax=Nocardioides sambongensis TaxID=2589074 RepID=UPI0015E8407D|nr:hypothetical protein [Nocardioides sambongensis]